MARGGDPLIGRGRELRTLALLAAPPLAVLAVFFGYPVAGMLARGLWPEGRLDLGGALATLGDPRTLRVLSFTVVSAGAATVLAVGLGLPAAYALHRLRVPGRRLLRALVLVPFVLPTVVVATAFTRLFGEGGPLAGWHLEGTTVLVVLALAYFNISVVVRTVGAFWEGMDRRREDAAAALGAAPHQVWLTVTLPALLPSIAAAASVVFLFCATSFGVVLVLGGLRHANIETEIYLLTTQELDLTSAAALSLLQLALIVALLALVGVVRRRQPPVDRAAVVRRPSRRDLPVLLVTGVVVAALVAPLAGLVQAALQTPGGAGRGNFTALARTDPLLGVSVLHSLGTSLLVSLQAGVFALVLGVLAAYVVARRPSGTAARRLVAGFDGVFMLPLGVSAVTLGFGFLITLDHPPLDLRSSPLLLPIAQGLVALPLVVRTLAPVWRSVDPRQREAAASLGASAPQVFATVDLPAAGRALLAATGFAFTVSLGEFGATSFLSRPDDPTLPVLIYRLLGQPGAQSYGRAMAASVLLAAATTLVMLGIERLRVDSAGAF